MNGANNLRAQTRADTMTRKSKARSNNRHRRVSARSTISEPPITAHNANIVAPCTGFAALLKTGTDKNGETESATINTAYSRRRLAQNTRKGYP